MTQLQRRVYAVLTRLSGEEVARLLTDYHGTHLLDGCFGDFLVEEGVAEREDIFDEGEEDPE